MNENHYVNTLQERNHLHFSNTVVTPCLFKLKDNKVYPFVSAYKLI